MEQDEEKETEIGRAAKMNPEVHKPTRQEIKRHEKTHCPFRPWCRHCVRGRAANAQHRRMQTSQAEEDCDDKPKVPRVAMDYFFMSKADEAAKDNPVICMLDEETGEKFARAVGQKGVGCNGEMNWLLQDTQSMGTCRRSRRSCDYQVRQ